MFYNVNYFKPKSQQINKITNDISIDFIEPQFEINKLDDYLVFVDNLIENHDTSIFSWEMINQSIEDEDDLILQEQLLKVSGFEPQNQDELELVADKNKEYLNKIFSMYDILINHEGIHIEITNDNIFTLDLINTNDNIPPFVLSGNCDIKDKLRTMYEYVNLSATQKIDELQSFKEHMYQGMDDWLKVSNHVVLQNKANELTLLKEFLIDKSLEDDVDRELLDDMISGIPIKTNIRYINDNVRLIQEEIINKKSNKIDYLQQKTHSFICQNHQSQLSFTNGFDFDLNINTNNDWNKRRVDFNQGFLYELINPSSVNLYQKYMFHNPDGKFYLKSEDNNLDNIYVLPEYFMLEVGNTFDGHSITYVNEVSELEYQKQLVLNKDSIDVKGENFNMTASNNVDFEIDFYKQNYDNTYVSITKYDGEDSQKTIYKPKSNSLNAINNGEQEKPILSIKNGEINVKYTNKPNNTIEQEMGLNDPTNSLNDAFVVEVKQNTLSNDNGLEQPEVKRFKPKM